MTLKRISKGKCFVAVQDGAIIGTVNYRQAGTADGCDWYEKPNVAYFGQFAVEPKLQCAGIGTMLLRHVDDQARLDGATELSFDTSERALKLIEYYEKRGYRFIEYVQWKEVNYRSRIFSKALTSR